MEDVASDLEKALLSLVAAPGWLNSSPVVVNQRAAVDGSSPSDLPDWDLGVNLALPVPSEDGDGWFADVERIVLQLASMRAQYGRDFVIGIADVASGRAEDLFYVESGTPDIDRLRRALGA